MNLTGDLLLIYNASGSFLGELKYISNKIYCSIRQKEAPCPACDITHSVKELGMKKEFSHLLLEFPNLKTLHTNELLDLAEFCSTIELPVLLWRKDDNVKVVADRVQLLKLNGSVQGLRDLILLIK
jgi:hypothetical protein